jgi:hypothetical protein
MSFNRALLVNPNRSKNAERNKDRIKAVRSARVATTTQANQWLESLFNLVRDIEQRHPTSSYIGMYNAWSQGVRDLYEAAALVANPVGAAAANPVAVVAPPLPAAAPECQQVIDHYEAIWGPLVLAAAPLGAIQVFPPHPPAPFMLEDEWEAFIDAVLFGAANSGFTGIGNMTQMVPFSYRTYPLDDIYEHNVRLEVCFSNMPENVTPFNIGAYYANRIAQAAKLLDYEFEWGKSHGVPKIIGYLGFSTWSFVDNECKPSNDEQLRALEEATAHALRDRATIRAHDPNVIADVDDDRGFHANRIMASHRRRESTRYQPNAGIYGYRFPAGQGGSRTRDDEYGD